MQARGCNAGVRLLRASRGPRGWARGRGAAGGAGRWQAATSRGWELSDGGAGLGEWRQ